MHRPIRRWITLTAVALTGVALVGFAVAARPSAQGAARPAGSTYTGKAFTFTEVAPGVYHAVGTGALAVGCNASVVVNDDDVLVVDTHLSAGAAWALREELKAITPKPIRQVVNTHWHWDHAHGNEVFGPEVEIIGHEYTRQRLAAGDSTRGRSWDQFFGGLPGRIDELSARIAKAADAGERATLEAQRSALQVQREGMAAVAVKPPTVTLADHLTLYRGSREIRLLYLGRGHTGGDVVVYLPKERAVITGDLLVEGTSYIGDGFIRDWPQTLDRLRGLDFDVALPGHGRAFRGKAKIDHFQAYLRDFWTQAEALHARGVPAQQAADQIDMRKHAANYPAITAPGVSWHGVARVYEELEGRAQ
jgi:glyoxylase-like metal-dependent hydrolase (beta-lactamase superfamily II)